MRCGIITAALGFVLCLPQLAQDRFSNQQTVRPSAPEVRVDRMLFADEATSHRLKAGEPIPTLNANVTVDELGLRILPPPKSPRDASNHFDAIKLECASSLTYLDRELDRLFKDQAADIATLRAQPALANEGRDSLMFQKLLALSKDPTLLEAETTFISTTKRLKVEEVKTSELTKDAIPMWRQLMMHSNREGGTPTTAEDSAAATRGAFQMRALDGQHFLDQYGPVFATYSKSVDDYVKQVVSALDTAESKLPLPTLVVARICKIKILSNYQILTQNNYQAWAAAASVGRQESGVEGNTDASWSSLEATAH